MAYLVGVREFMGHRFEVSPDVLIPRPETELLVELVLKSCLGLPHPKVLDLGTGSGAVAISVALARPDAIVVASDQSAAALTVAQDDPAYLGIDEHLGTEFTSVGTIIEERGVLGGELNMGASKGSLSRGQV